MTLTLEQTKKIFLKAKSMLDDDHGAEDVVQVVSMKFHKQAYEKIENHLDAWLMTVTRNHCLKILEKRSRYTVAEPEFFQDKLFDENSPRDIMDIREQHDLQMNILSKCVAGLKAHHRKILELRYNQGLSYDDIGKSMNMTNSNVGNMLHRIHKQLKHLMQHNKYHTQTI